jgi:hypothetical protein
MKVNCDHHWQDRKKNQWNKQRNQFSYLHIHSSLGYRLPVYCHPYSNDYNLAYLQNLLICRNTYVRLPKGGHWFYGRNTSLVTNMFCARGIPW